MTRFYRSIIALFLGLLLGGFATYASAETIPATYGPTLANWYWKVSYISDGVKYPDCSSAATASAGTYDYPSAACVSCTGTRPSYYCQRQWTHRDGSTGIYGNIAEHCDGTWNSSLGACVTGSNSYSCPVGGYTLNGSNCVRADCAVGQTRDASGQCISQACPTGQFSSGYYQGAVPGAACTASGCMVSFSGTYPAGRDPQGNLYASGSYSYMGGNQGECTPGSGSVAVPATATTTPTTTAPGPTGCAAGDGVITSSSGKVACVPAGTAGSTTPKNNTTGKTENFSDGSSITTNTTQVCTGDGACQTITTTTIGAATGGGAGQAGTPGTSTAQIEKPPTETSDFCAQNPALQLCKGDMNKEVTQIQIRDELKKLTTPDAADDSPLTGATHSAESQTALEAENNKFTQAATGVVDATSGNRSAWESALSSGLLSPIPISSCAPYSVNIGGRPWTWDYCPTATKISEIGAYALWVMLAFGVFAMLTGGRNTGV